MDKISERVTKAAARKAADIEAAQELAPIKNQVNQMHQQLNALEKQLSQQQNQQQQTQIQQTQQGQQPFSQ